MTPDPKQPPSHEDQVLHLLVSHLKQTTRIADALESVARSLAPEAPNYQRQLAEFADFDWSNINAKVISTDDDGPTHVEWGEYTWQRRSPQNKFGQAIWFSRPNGKDADGQNKYVRLITFRQPSEAEPVPDKVSKAIETGKPSRTPDEDAGQSAGNGKTPDLKGLVAKLDKPSSAVALLESCPGHKLFPLVRDRFRIDLATATDIASESNGDWAKALAGLDQHVF